MTDDDGQLMVVTPQMIQVMQQLVQSGQLQLPPGAQLGQPIPTAMQGTQQGGVPSVEELERAIVEPYITNKKRLRRSLTDQITEARRRTREPHNFLRTAFYDARVPLTRLEESNEGWHLADINRGDRPDWDGGRTYYEVKLGYNGDKGNSRNGNYSKAITIQYSGIKIETNNHIDCNKYRGIPGQTSDYSISEMLEDELERRLEEHKKDLNLIVGDKLVFRTKYNDKDIVVEERDYPWLVGMYQQGVTLGQIALMMFGTVKDGGSAKSHKSVIDQLDAYFAGKQTQFYPNQEAPAQLAGPQGQQVVYVMVQPSGNVGQLGVQGMQLLGGTNQRLITGGNDD